MDSQCDVIIVGAGNAALCAAIAAREQGASVLVLEKAPEYFRGGNTYFTGGIIRCAYNGIEDIKKLIPDMSPEEEASVDVGQYTEDQFYDDLMRVTNGLADPELAQILVSESFPTLKWLQERGVRYVLAFGSIALFVLMMVKAVTTPHKLPFQNVGDVQAPGAPPSYASAVR